jgi:DNA-binding response OmpR family regulator
LIGRDVQQQISSRGHLGRLQRLVVDELAQRLRAQPRTQAVPIIMITSRVGAKHRARALELGVNEYLGKPYQEAELLAAIAPLVAAKGSPRTTTAARSIACWCSWSASG